MATLNVPKAFEKGLIPGDVRGKIEPFVDFVNQNFDQILRAFPNQLTLSENIRGIFKSVSAVSNTAIAIETSGIKPQGILILKSEVAIRSYTATVLSSGVLSIVFKFDEATPVLSLAVSVSAPFATYQIDGASTVTVGDLVEISQFGTKLNNGTFVVLERVDNLINVVNSSAAAETKPAQSGERETSKIIDLFILT